MKRQELGTLHQFALSLGVGWCLIFACVRILDASEPPPEVRRTACNCRNRPSSGLCT